MNTLKEETFTGKTFCGVYHARVAFRGNKVSQYNQILRICQMPCFHDTQFLRVRQIRNIWFWNVS